MELKRDPPSFKSIRRLRIGNEGMGSSALTPGAVRSGKSKAIQQVSTTSSSSPQMNDDDRNSSESEVDAKVTRNSDNDVEDGSDSDNSNAVSSTMSLSSGERGHIDVKEAEISCNEGVNGCDDGSNVV